MRHVNRVSLLLLPAALLAGCGGGGPLGIFKKTDKVTVPGDRVAVLVNPDDSGRLNADVNRKTQG